MSSDNLYQQHTGSILFSSAATTPTPPPRPPPGQQFHDGRLGAPAGYHYQQSLSASQLYPRDARKVRPQPARFSLASASSHMPSQPTRRHSTAAAIADTGLHQPISGAHLTPNSSIATSDSSTTANTSLAGVRLHQRGHQHQRPQPGRRYRSRAQTAAILFNNNSNKNNNNINITSASDGRASHLDESGDNNVVVVVDMPKGRQLLDGSTNSIASSNKTLTLSRILLPPVKLATMTNKQYQCDAETSSRKAPPEVGVAAKKETSSEYNASQRELGTRRGISSSPKTSSSSSSSPSTSFSSPTTSERPQTCAFQAPSPASSSPSSSSSSSSSSSLGNSSYYSPAISHGQYSSSQAHLQSLTSQPNLNLNLNNSNSNANNSGSSSSLLIASSLSPESIGAIKTPTPTGYWPPSSSSATNGCRLHNWRTQTATATATGSNTMRPNRPTSVQQQQQRMQTVATATPSPPPLVDNSTKPMSTSSTSQAQPSVQLIEPSGSSPSSSFGGWRRLNNYNFNPAPGHTRTSLSTGHLASDYQHPLPPPYSPVDEQSHQQQQQQHQALSSSGQPLANDQAASSTTLVPAPAPSLANPISSGANNYAHQQQLQVQQHNRQQCSQQQQQQQQQLQLQQPLQHHLSPQPAAAVALPAAATQAAAGASPNDGVSCAKSKSCLACADISIKWYIVVIALLGLMCALIGTIVGAVHSAGRDYISLSLLLLGVGLVLIAISWVSLRITINTYKTNTNSGANTGQPWTSSSSRVSTRLGFGPGSASQQHRHPHLHQPQQHHLNGGTTFAGQPGRARHSQNQLLAASLANQAMLNERLYMMAAMAAAAAAASSGSNPVPQTTSNSQCGTLSGGTRRSRPNSSSSEPGQTHGLMEGIKRRLPHCLSRFLSFGVGSQSTTQDSQGTSASANRHSQEQLSSLASDTVARRQSHQQTRASIPAQTNPTSAATTNTLASLLHQYQMLQQQAHPIMPFLAPHHNPMQPPPIPPPPINLFAAGLANYLHDPLFRPPPPSYNATMQEQRFRMIMQERATLQQLQQQQQQQWSSSSTQRVSPSAAPAPISGGSESGATATASDATGASSNGTRSEELATANGSSKPDSCHCVVPADTPDGQQGTVATTPESTGQTSNDDVPLSPATAASAN